MKFTLKDQKTPAPGYWKMNSSILNDPTYVKIIEQTVERMDQNLFISPIDWWDLFILMVRNKTINYSTQRRHIENEVKTEIIREINKIEAMTEEHMTIDDKRNYKHLKVRFKDISRKKKYEDTRSEQESFQHMK